jgi:hypothetical protein
VAPPTENKKEEKRTFPWWSGSGNQSNKKQTSGTRSEGPGKSSPPPTGASKKPQTSNVPALSMWTQNADGSVVGFVSNSEDFRTGTKITTSPVSGSAKAGTVVTTVSGSRYRLGQIGITKTIETNKGKSSSERKPPFSLFGNKK